MTSTFGKSGDAGKRADEASGESQANARACASVPAGMDGFRELVRAEGARLYLTAEWTNAPGLETDEYFIVTRTDDVNSERIATVSDVLMEDIELEGEAILDGDSRIRKNEYAERISFATTGDRSTGATLRRSMSSEELDALEGPLLIE